MYLATIIWLGIHLLIAVGLNWIFKELKWIMYGEVITVYFIILATKAYYTQLRFFAAYYEDPDGVEESIRETLFKDKQ